VVPNPSRPEGLQVWNADPLQEISDRTGYGDPFSSLRPIRLVGTRNGACSGQVVVSSNGGLKGVTASVSDLTRTGGGGAVPREALQVRYGARARVPGDEKGRLRELHYFDILADQPLRDTQVQPIWVTVNIPADARPGEYRGTLTVRPGGEKPVEVPLRLTVCGWKLPDPGDFVTHVSLLQSPESVALKYKVPLWSRRHFELLEKSLALLGQVGNKVVYITVVRRTHFGNEHGMIRFRRAAGGRYEPDFSVFDKYLGLYAKHVGRPAVLCLYVWEPNMNTRRGRLKEVPLTLVEPTGKMVEWSQPMYGAEGSEALWKAVMEGVRQRVMLRRWSEECIVLGVVVDNRPHPTTVKLFKKIAPYARWAFFTHGRGDPRPKDGKWIVQGMAVGYYETSGGGARLRYPLGERLLYGWNQPYLRAGSMRGFLLAYSPLGSYRNIAEATVTGNCRGFGRFGLDFWPLSGTADARRAGILGRYRTNNTLDINLMRDNPRSIVSPGPDGATATVRFEMLREGIQECEARIFIEKALDNEQLRARLGEELVKRCREVLNERFKMHLVGRISWAWFASSGWQDRTARLYNLTAQVAEAIGHEK